jgi:DNA polymerase-3 subunit beta
MIVEVKQLREALAKCSGIVARRSPLPICGSVLLDGRENTLTIRATDLEKMVEVTIPCSGELWSGCVPYRILNKFVSQGMGTVSLGLKNRQLILDRPLIGQLRIGGIKEASEFPPFSTIDSLAWKELDAKEVCRLFGVVAQGCAKEESRPVLTGVCCRQGEIASADGFRLYNAVSTKFDFGLSTLTNNKIIPRATVLQVIKLFGKQEKMQVAFGENVVYFKSGGTSLSAQLVQGTYPKYEKLIPTSFSSKVIFSVPLMLERLKLMDALSGNITRLWFEKVAGGDLFYISGKYAEEDDMVYDLNLPCKIETAEVGKIAVQYNYLFDAIKAFSICSMELTNPSSPMKFTGDIEGLTVITMPMFIEWS